MACWWAEGLVSLEGLGKGDPSDSVHQELPSGAAWGQLPPPLFFQGGALAGMLAECLHGASPESSAEHLCLAFERLHNLPSHISRGFLPSPS